MLKGLVLAEMFEYLDGAFVDVIDMLILSDYLSNDVHLLMEVLSLVGIYGYQ